MSNLEAPMFEVYMWSISDISVERGGAISAVHFSAEVLDDNYHHSYGAVFKVNEEANEDAFDRLFRVLKLNDNSVLALDDDSLMMRR